VGAHCGEEAVALLGREVLPAAGVDEGHFDGGRHRRRPPGRGVPEIYVTLRERSIRAIPPAFSGALSPAIAATAGEREREDQKVYRIEIL
jgi:hypothetical protein